MIDLNFRTTSSSNFATSVRRLSKLSMFLMFFSSIFVRLIFSARNIEATSSSSKEIDINIVEIFIRDVRVRVEIFIRNIRLRRTKSRQSLCERYEMKMYQTSSKSSLEILILF